MKVPPRTSRSRLRIAARKHWRSRFSLVVIALSLDADLKGSSPFRWGEGDTPGFGVGVS